MSIINQIKKRFPQIILSSQESDLAGEKNPTVTYSCLHHGTERTEKLNKLMARKFSCSKCANLLNKGHVFNLDGNPLAAKKIKDLMVIFGGKFDYSKFEATETVTPGTIICKTHGEFKSSLTDHLLNHGVYGCHSCETGIATKQPTTEAKEKPKVGTEKAMLANSLAKIEAEKRPDVSAKKQIPSDWLDKAKSVFFSASS